MKSGKPWCLVVGLLVGASLQPAVRAQDPASSKAQPSQNSSNFENQLRWQVQNQGNNPQGDVRQWNAQGIHSNFHRWSVQPQGDNPQLVWGPYRADFFASSGTPQDLNLSSADDSLRDHLNLPKDQGIVVISVNPQSSAAQAGIQQNDILLTVGEHSLGKPEDLYDRLKEVGEKPVTIMLLRAGTRKSIQVQPKIRVTLHPVAVKAAPRDYWIGITVVAIDPTLRAQLRLSQPHAVIVNQVVPDSPAAKAGIAIHDIIVAIDGSPIVNPQDVSKIVQAKGEKAIVMELIGKGGKPRSVSVTPGRRKTAETSQAISETVKKAVAYDVVHPGIVYPSQVYAAELPYASFTAANPPMETLVRNPKSDGQSLNDRLEALNTELKALRSLVEELRKTEAMILERQKGGGEAPKE